ncbi:hypothetical protein [Parablautia muri]|uniref:Uncharacterized protein n=1 Tax=Parablautia muri TaxID=2320879 RepID=A0A9X5BGH6_9FIRM|nr:hypothetical protein [Parablautia muri]NBJ93212.1 hypothetical protein [Parablautia muri]
MTQKELFLSLKSYQDFDKNRGAFRGMRIDDEIRAHSDKIFPKAYAPKDMHREVRLVDEE